jgi:anti-anti-sigma factor
MPASSHESEFREGVIHVVPEADGIVAVCLDGEFDLADAQVLGERISEGLGDGTGLIIDLSDATFIESTVIQVLVQAARAAASQQKPAVLQLATASVVERTIEVVGIERILPRARDRHEALRIIRGNHAVDSTAPDAVDGNNGEVSAAKLVALTYVNINIVEAAIHSVAQGSTWDFFCECGTPACDDRIALTLDQYRGLRDAGRAILAPGHQVDERARAQALRADAEALRAQARHQVRRATKSLSEPCSWS